MEECDWNATILLAGALSEDKLDGVMDKLSIYHVALSLSSEGDTEVILTLEGERVFKAFSCAKDIALSLQKDGFTIRGIAVIPTSVFDARSGLAREDIPDSMIGSTEASARLGISKTALHKKIRSGVLEASKVNGKWMFSSRAVARASGGRY